MARTFLFIFIFCPLLISQTMNIHTVSGTVVYNLADIDSITFSLSPDTNVVTDIDGNVYHTVTIGSQIWLVENLRVTHFRNGDEIPNVTVDSVWATMTSGAYCHYNNNPSNVNPYGCLYNWYTLTDSRGVAPVGWHVATDTDWQTLVDFLGGELIAGGALKDTILWRAPNTGATNSSGFSALPAGYRYFDGTFDNLGDDSHFWSATENSATLAWGRLLLYNSAQISRGSGHKESGFSVRCVKD